MSALDLTVSTIPLPQNNPKEIQVTHVQYIPMFRQCVRAGEEGRKMLWHA